MATGEDRFFGTGNGERDLSLRDLLLILWDGRRTIAICVGFCLIVGFVSLWLATPRYEVGLQVASAAPPSESNELRQLAALIPGGRDERSADPFAEYQVLLHSERLAQRLNRDHRAAQKIFPYDEAAGRFYMPASPVVWAGAALRWIVGLPGWTPPDDAALAEYLRAQVEISAHPDTPGIYRIGLRHPDPVFARDLLLWMHEGTDALLRESRRERAERYIGFLTEGLRQEQNVEIREAMRTLLLQQVQQRMMTGVDVGYAARIIDGPTVSSRPVSPGPGRTLFLALVIGLGLGIVWVFLRGRPHRT